MSKPTKEQLRKWQQNNREQKRPPVSPEQARKELGWEIAKEQQKQRN